VRFRVFLSDGSSKTLKTALYKTNRVKRFLKKNRRKIQNQFLSIFYHVFGRFSVRGVQKHDKQNIEKINLTASFFHTLTHPPTTGVTDFFFGRPLMH
jgi:hypothetical protein